MRGRDAKSAGAVCDSRTRKLDFSAAVVVARKKAEGEIPFCFFLLPASYLPFRNLMGVRIESQAEPIPGYRLIERLGGGGFGEVWKAMAPGGLPKAIKFVYGDLQAASSDGVRAEQELKALSRVKTVRHPYVLSLERYDIIDGQLIIVMELADRNLWDRFKECRVQGLPGIPREELLRYMQEASEALDLMNVEYQLQHLDIKPQNLFLVHNHAKVADFGLVKDLQGMMASVTGGITPVYAAPETFDGWISRFCDQYSLAIVYQELLTGQRPFSGTNVGQLIMQHLRSAPNLASLPAGDREAVGRALSKSPDDRFPKCQDFLRALWGNEARGATPVRLPVPDSGLVNRLTPSRGAEDTPVRSTPKEGQSDGAHTPKLPTSMTAPAADKGRWIRVNELAEPAREVEPAPSIPAPQVQPDGILFPALVIGLGQTGLTALQRLRQSFEDTVGGADVLPNIRWLYVDTDPDALRLAGQCKAGGALSGAEILQTRLNRPSHYLRSASRGRLESWFDLKLLYRIPRNPATTGVRVLGRLAFFDCYRGITARLNKELEACTHPETLAKVARLPGFGLRSVRPRVYIVTSLAGGTGSGMFLDLAYVLRKLLRAQGHERPDIVGLFVLPGVDRCGGQSMALANAFAALTELNHFSAPETTFWAHFDDSEPPVRDTGPPYDRCIVLQLPAGDDGGQLQDRAGLIADWLYHDLLTPLGRIADERRADLPAPDSSSSNLVCQSFGMYQISWPRFAFLRSVGRNLCHQLVRDWLSKDASPVRERVKAAVDQEWNRLGLKGEQLLPRLQQACADALGQNPESAFAAVVEPLAGLDFSAIDPAPAAQAIEQLEQLVGQPGEVVTGPPGQLEEPLDAVADVLRADFGKKLGLFVLSFVEQTGARLAGAEEAVRQCVALIEQELQKQERLGKELAARADNAYAKMKPLLTTLRQGSGAKNRRAASSASTLLELVRCYPKWRYESLILRRLANVYVSLRGQLTDQLREINYCRSRLTELQTTFAEPLPPAPEADSSGRSRLLFPAGFRNLAEAANQTLEEITPEELVELDGRMQRLLREEFEGLAHVCLASANLLTSLREAMQREAETFVDTRLAGLNVAEMYLAHHTDEEEVRDDLDGVYEDAAPELGARTSPRGEICIVTAPPGPAGERFRELARNALADVELVAAVGTHDIVFYREVPHVRLADLEQLGPLGYEAYRQIVTMKNLTAHSRMDINEWRAAGG
jgi:serine/threonine protein kinase